MNRRGKIFAENLKRATEAKLMARMSLLKARGLSGEEIQRDAFLRKIKGILRKAAARLAAIAAQEQLNIDRVKAKAEKLAAEKAAREQVKEEPQKEGAEKEAKKAKKEKTDKAEPKEKKEKKEKAQKKEKEEKQGKKEPSAA